MNPRQEKPARRYQGGKSPAMGVSPKSPHVGETQSDWRQKAYQTSLIADRNTFGRSLSAFDR